AGKEVLIKVVAQFFPTYSMSVFKLPVSLCDELNSIMSNFWWHWLSWGKLCKSKYRGGLGFRDLQAFKLAKQG
ncbi:hypothetical protein CFOL_v3_20334, partial [Cephalotus follicularis]